jgi:hypothetical protein
MEKDIIVFIRSTLLGQFSGFYKINGKNEFATSFKTVFPHVITHYLNGAYKSLILKDDEYIIKTFSSLTSHSAVCLLHMFLHITRSIVDNFNYNNLRMDNYTDFMESVDSELMKSEMLKEDKIRLLISHRCEGYDISSCDPNIPLFYT